MDHRESLVIAELQMALNYVNQYGTKEDIAELCQLGLCPVIQDMSEDQRKLLMHVAQRVKQRKVVDIKKS